MDYENTLSVLRGLNRLSQRKLAELSDVSTSELSYIERGVKVPNVYLAIRIARVLNTTVEVIWGGENDRERT